MTVERRDLTELAWPESRLAEAAVALTRRLGWGRRDGRTEPAAPAGMSPEGALTRICALSDLDAEPVDAGLDDLDTTLRALGPGLVRLPAEGDGSGRVLVLLRGGGRKVTVLTPGLERRRLDVDVVSRCLLEPVAAPHRGRLEGLLERAEVPDARRSGVRRALLGRLLPAVRVQVGWVLRPASGSGFVGQLRDAGVLGRLALFLGVHAVHFSLWLTSWWLLGRGALAGRFEAGWWIAWALLLASLVPLRLTELWLQGRISIDAGALVKRRLLDGALRLAPDATRSQGIGQLLGRVLESDAVEALALGGGFSTLLAAVELGFAFWVLAHGAGGGLHVLLLLSTLVLAAVWTRRYVRRRHRWTRHRLALTHDLVERMVGHRTRRIQEPADGRHDREDQLLSSYVDPSRAQDRSATRLALLGRGWVLLGIATLAPAFVQGASRASLALGLGGVLLTQRALDLLAIGLLQLGNAAVSWRRVSPVFAAAERRPAPGRVSPPAESAPPDRPVLEALDLAFRYGSRAEPVLRGATVRLYPRDRVLVEGPSGGGKSTLGLLLAGLREPDSGLLLLRGLDPATVGEEGWRRQVGVAPQFHENHVLAETFAFNVLMGREWPPEEADLLEADEICRELGLGELLDRMPGGLVQMVGESGWQLSHGERSRVFIARALLQRADVVILDESFAALDPESLERALECVERRAPTLVVIAHP